MKCRPYVAIIMAMMTILLPGCGCRVIDWTKSSFNQGRSLPDYYSTAQSYVRSVSLYDQFQTLAIFDALWVAQEVLGSYADLWALKNGKIDDEQKNFLQCQLAEHGPYLTFYILSLYDVALVHHQSSWSLLLEVDGRLFDPVELKAVELDSFYQLFFGRCCTRFKVPYKIKFCSVDSNGNEIVTAQTKQLSLIFRSVDKEGVMTWDVEHIKESCS